jgi:hypothetical protein
VLDTQLFGLVLQEPEREGVTRRSLCAFTCQRKRCSPPALFINLDGVVFTPRDGRVSQS